jgi:hypothetical protein
MKIALTILLVAACLVSFNPLHAISLGPLDPRPNKNPVIKTVNNAVVKPLAKTVQNDVVKPLAKDKKRVSGELSTLWIQASRNVGTAGEQAWYNVGDAFIWAAEHLRVKGTFCKEHPDDPACDQGPPETTTQKTEGDKTEDKKDEMVVIDNKGTIVASFVVKGLGALSDPEGEFGYKLGVSIYNYYNPNNKTAAELEKDFGKEPPTPPAIFGCPSPYPQCGQQKSPLPAAVPSADPEITLPLKH